LPPFGPPSDNNGDSDDDGDGDDDSADAVSASSAASGYTYSYNGQVIASDSDYADCSAGDDYSGLDLAPSPESPSLALRVSDPHVPDFIPFTAMEPVLDLLRSVLEREHVSVPYLRRLALRLLVDSTSISPKPPKPHAFNVRDMFSAEHFECGASLVTDHPLKAPVIESYHVRFCTDCSVHGSLLPHCYFYTMLQTILYGWAPTLLGKVEHLFHYMGNYPAANKFPRAMAKEIAKWVKLGVVTELSANDEAHLTALNCVIKNSDRHRARAITGLEIDDDDSLERVNVILADLGFSPIKVRPVLDCTGSGFNEQTVAPPFTYGSISDAFAIIKPNDYLVKTDISNYFGCFPLAEWLRWLLCFEFLGAIYQAACVVFGIRPAPYFASTWGAEIHMWFSSMGIASAHMQDDFLFPAASEPEAFQLSSTVATVFNSCGWPTNPEKTEVSQSLVFVGFLLDTTTMTCSFSKDNARGFLAVFTAFADSLRLNQFVSFAALRSIAGKLNDYAQLLQEGRLHIRSFWQFIHAHPLCDDALRDALFVDIDWWTHVLTMWASDQVSGLEFPILNSSVFASDSYRVLSLMTDASGLQTDGFGGIWTWLCANDYTAFAVSWSLYRQRASHSHGQELQALLYWLQHTVVRNILLIWVTDCASACWSINKGYCSCDASFDILRNIFKVADVYGISIVSLWVPREQIQLCDYLTHLTAITDRDILSGSLSELVVPAHRLRASGEESTFSSDADKIQVVRDSSWSGEPLGNLASSPPVLMRPCSEESGLRQVPFELSVAAQDFVPFSAAPLAGRDGCLRSPPLCAGAQVPRLHSIVAQGPFDAAHPGQNIQPSLELPQGHHARCCPLDGPRWSSPCRRDSSSLHCPVDTLGPSSKRLHGLSRAHKNASLRSSLGDSISGSPWPMRRQSSASPLRCAELVEPAQSPAVPNVLPLL
jgi:hypothetical protein